MLAPERHVGLVQRAALGDAGIGDADLDRAARLDRGADAVRHGVLVADVHHLRKDALGLRRSSSFDRRRPVMVTCAPRWPAPARWRARCPCRRRSQAHVFLRCPSASSLNPSQGYLSQPAWQGVATLLPQPRAAWLKCAARKLPWRFCMRNICIAWPSASGVAMVYNRRETCPRRAMHGSTAWLPLRERIRHRPTRRGDRGREDRNTKGSVRGRGPGRDDAGQRAPAAETGLRLRHRERRGRGRRLHRRGL